MPMDLPRGCLSGSLARFSKNPERGMDSLNGSETNEIRCGGARRELTSPNVLIRQSDLGLRFLPGPSGFSGASFCKTRRFEGFAKMVHPDNEPPVDQA